MNERSTKGQRSYGELAVILVAAAMGLSRDQSLELQECEILVPKVIS
jgi:hypothetical protein